MAVSTKQYPWRLLIVAVAAVAVAVLAFAFLAGRTGDVERLRSMPEGSLAYPGSTEIDRGGFESSPSVTGDVAASAWRVLGVDASPDEVYEYFAAELTQRGWRDDSRSSSAIPATDESTAHAWTRDGLTFRLGIRDPDSWRADDALVERYETIYDARLIGPNR